MKRLAIQYITFGHHHVARLLSINRVFSRHGYATYGVQMFSEDSDYAWTPADTKKLPFMTETVFNGASATVRRSRDLRKGIVRFLDQLQPDVVVISGWGLPENRPCIDWCIRQSVPSIVLSDSQEKDFRRRFWKEFLKSRTIKKFSGGFVAGSPQREYLEKLGMPRHRIALGSCVVDNDYWQKEAIRIRSQSDFFRKGMDLPDKYFLAVGRFIPKKNFLLLLTAYETYRQKTNAPLPLLICGSGPLENQMKTLITQRRIEGVILRGFQQADTLPYYYALATCFIMPSSNGEQWGLVVNEAMASGLPVLVSDACGCARDLVQNGVNGYTFLPNDPNRLADLLGLLVKDESQTTEMSKASSRIISASSCDWAAENLWKCVRDIPPL